MIRNRFDELCVYLKAQHLLLKVRPEQFDSELEDFTVEPGGHNVTVNGLYFANFRYRGILYIERLPQSTLPYLALLVKAWLDDNDDVRGDFRLPAPSIQAVNLDGKLMDVVVTTEFIDPVYLAESADGPVKFCGKSYAVAEYAVCVAETGEVNHART